jgi:hypothetical protein
MSSVLTKHYDSYEKAKAKAKSAIQQNCSCYCNSRPDETDGETFAECTTGRIKTGATIEEVQ